MMNKGLEVIEASYLFALTPDESMCWCIRNRSSTAWSNFSDRSVVRSWALPTCARRSPIASDGPIALSDLPHRLISPKIGQLTFEAPDFDRFRRFGSPMTPCGRQGRDHRL